MKNPFEGVSVFLATVEAGGFASAAECLGLSRSAVAKTIGRIEHRLGVKLFNRTTRRNSLTEEGYFYYERCVRALEELRAGESMLEFERFNVKGRLKVAMPASFGRHCVAPLLLDLAEKYQNLNLDLRFSDTYHDFVAERYDLAIRSESVQEADYFLNVRKIAAQRQVLCAAPSYLVRCGPVHSLEDIRNHDALVYWKNEQPCLWDFRDISVAEFKLPSKWRLQFDNQEAMADAALRGMMTPAELMVTIMPHMMGGMTVLLMMAATEAGWAILPLPTLSPRKKTESSRCLNGC